MATQLPFTPENARQMLDWGRSPDTSPATHRQIAEWCDRFWCSYLDIDAPQAVQRVLPVLADVDVQWDLFLANTFGYDKLPQLDLDQVRMPVEWFADWALQLEV